MNKFTSELNFMNSFATCENNVYTVFSNTVADIHPLESYICTIILELWHERQQS